jgi:hypothetical protein
MVREASTMAKKIVQAAELHLLTGCSQKGFRTSQTIFLF